MYIHTYMFPFPYGHVVVCRHLRTKGLCTCPFSAGTANTHCARRNRTQKGESGERGERKERTREKMKEILEQLWRDFCFEQNIESGPICMADVADFFDFVELMTDTFSDDGK